MSHLLLAVIRGYRCLLSPWWGGQCRFTPTCSEYAMDAIHEHGALRGTWLAMRRVSKCHPWHHGGFDPAP
jgi:putative membrane protein insertion efficiency factor